MQDQLESLLKQIAAIIEEEKKQKQHKYDSGETFNVFEVLRLQRNEVRLHSSFIATLLDPNGPHGMKTKLLKSFLRVTEAEGVLDDLAAVKVEKELYVGPITKKGDEGGRMDIVLMDKHKNAVVIENKVDAKDQPNQLLRYDNYCKKHFKNYRIIYLTKWGDYCSDDSCGGRDIQYLTASYNVSILTWLDDCIALSEKIQPVNETIIQYRSNLVEILNIMSQKSENEFLSVVTDNKNIESTITILENSIIIERKIRFDFLQKLILLAEKYGFVVDKEEADHLADLEKNRYLLFKHPDHSKNYGIYIGNEDGFYWYGIGAYGKKRITKTILQQLEPQWGSYDRRNQKIDYPYGFDYFWSETGGKDSGSWFEWDNYDTLRAMSDGRFLAFIEKKILKITVEQNLLEDLEAAIK